jgi:hypothetical protein
MTYSPFSTAFTHSLSRVPTSVLRQSTLYDESLQFFTRLLQLQPPTSFMEQVHIGFSLSSLSSLSFFSSLREMRNGWDSRVRFSILDSLTCALGWLMMMMMDVL